MPRGPPPARRSALPGWAPAPPPPGGWDRAPAAYQAGAPPPGAKTAHAGRAPAPGPTAPRPPPPPRRFSPPAKGFVPAASAADLELTRDDFARAARNAV